MKQSFCLPCFQQEGITRQDLFAHAKAIGFDAVEIWSPGDDLEEIHAAASEAKLTVCSFTGHDSIENGLNDPSQWKRIEEELVFSIDRAAALQVPGIICFSGARRPGLSDSDGLSLFVQGIGRVIRHAEERKVNLNLEVLNSTINHPDYMADTVDWTIRACEEVNSPRMRILFDVYHVQIMEGDLIRSLRRTAPHLGHIHTAGNPGRHELDDDQEINYRAIGRELRRLGYQGYVGHELFPIGDKLAALRSAFDAMREAL